MKLSLYLFLLALAIAGCGRSKNTDTDNYQATKETLAGKEKKNPVAFLVIGGNEKRNWLGQTVVKGTLRNRASLVSYRDIRVKMLFYGKEGKLVANHEDVYPDILAPGATMKFKARYGTPRGTDSVVLSIMSAVVAEER